MSESSLDQNATSVDVIIGDRPFDIASVFARLALFSQLLIAASCLISFEGYLRTGCHPLVWEETAVRFAHSFRWAFFICVAIISAFARIPVWRRIICVIASYILAEIINEVFWGAIVRY